MKSKISYKKLWKKLLPTFLFMTFICAMQMNVYAQNLTVNGKVSDENGISMPGVNVSVKGTTIGTTTNVEGDFTINAPSDAVLLFSFIGYLNQEAAVDNRTTISIVLSEDVIGVGEVVVTALGIKREKKALG